MILQNQIHCLHCGDEPYSATVHDYRSCKCGKVFVDGGMAYLRRGWPSGLPQEHYREMSIEIPDEAAKAAQSALVWARENGRNNLGALCAVARALRDNGVSLNATA